MVERDGVNYIERLSELFYKRPVDQFFVDSGLTYDGGSNGEVMTITASDYGSDNTCDLSTVGDYFDGSMVGKYIKLGDDDSLGLVQIDSVTDAKNAVGFIQIGIPEDFQGVPFTNWGLAVNEVTGLDHLEGKEVLDGVVDLVLLDVK